MRMRMRALVENARATLWAGLVLAAGAAPISLRAQVEPSRTRPAGVEQPPVTMDRFLAPGPEAARLSRQVGRWDVVMAIRPRAPIGIMFAKGFESDVGPQITVYFENFANPGLAGVGGSVRARHVDKAEGEGRHVKRQFWTRPGAPEWLAVQYEYTRRR